MFAIEIQFQDGTSEVVMIRRPIATVGGDDACQVIIDDMHTAGYHFEIARDFGRSFRVRKVHDDSSKSSDPSELYDTKAKFNVADLGLLIRCIDTDLLIRDTEPPDRAGVRILRQATTVVQPKFPAVLVLGNPQLVVSFDKHQPIYIGRAKQCLLRIEKSDLSSQHARIGFENNEFWIEDLGSTNGSFVNDQQVSGRVSVAPAVPMVLGRDTTIMGVLSEHQLRSIEKSALGVVRTRAQSTRRYPILISVSEVARPARIVIPDVGHGQVQIGRDPTSDMWLGAPHVSRMHCSFALDDQGQVVATDQSTNGTLYDFGRLSRGEASILNNEPVVFDFGSGITVALCFNEQQEQSFVASQGSKTAFNKNTESGLQIKPLGAPRYSLKDDLDNISQDGEESFEDSSDSDERFRERKPTGTFQALNVAYKRSGREGKLVMALVVLATIFLVLVVGFLLMHTFG
jgi:pSer/pThr/pTyr-binding forkhead associated (FHA) protein